MTDLIQAIAELRRVTPPNSPWEAGDIGVGSSPVDYHIATILNAVISGDLIPKADADLSVALMVERAATHVRTAEVPREETGEGAMQRALLNYAADVVSLCAPASALAELQALRGERDAYKAASEAAHTDITTYLKIVADMTQEAEAAEAELATLRAQVERLTGALTIAANRLHRCSVDYDTGTREFIEVGGWADEARAALTEGAVP